MSEYKILKTEPSGAYELLDSGEGEKLERYGKIILSRPDPQALWPKNLPDKEWQKAQAIFLRDGKSTEWKIKPGVPEKWEINFAGLKFWIRPTAFKHTGLFPEQVSNWNWVAEKIRMLTAGQAKANPSTPPLGKGRRPISPSFQEGVGGVAGDRPRVLNLFGYTGGASLACAQAGAEVCHVDGSKVAIGWARDNAELSGLKDKPIRWILDDAKKFVQREIKRGRKYDGIIMDPPAFGHGPGGEVWKIEENFLEFLDLCRQILSEKPLFFLINGYASGYSALAYKNNLEDLMKGFGGEIEIGELTIAESKSERLLPCGIFARWSCR
jgi:23S rRNA (cytosine1962-C5)-methyltransferase